MKLIGAIAAVLLAGCSSTQDAEPLDIVARAKPVITSVTTDDGFTQVRQNATVTLVIQGKKLQNTTSVTVGGFFVSLDSVKAREIRVTVFAPDTPLGPTDVTVISAQDTTVAPGAIELTPFVVSPTAVAGHGTFQSPMSLCDQELEFSTDFTSTILLLAGTHRCGRLIFVNAGTITGDPEQPTVLTGTDDGGFGMVAGNGDTVIRDLTFAPPLAEWSIDVVGGNQLTVERVVDAGGVIARDNHVLKLDHYTYEGEGNAVDAFEANITNSTIHHCGSGTGITARAGSNGGFVTIDHTIVEDCDVGIAFIGPQNEFALVGGVVSSSQLLDNTVGITANVANMSVHDTVIRSTDAAPRVSSTGIAVNAGFTDFFDAEIIGQRDIGLSISGGPGDEEDTVVFAHGVVITGGQYGIAFGGIDNNLALRNSVIRDQTIASLAVSNLDGLTDLGFPGDPGNNQLSVISGFAIDDSRFSESGLNHFIHATGTTLNGVSFDGQSIDGPAELAPFYRIAFDSGIQF